MMLAERAADLIRGDTPLAADPAPYYRHDQEVHRAQSDPALGNGPATSR